MHDERRPQCTDHDDEATHYLDLKNLKVISALGRGARGVVFLVGTDDGELFALKAMLRSSIERKKLMSAGNGGEYRRICFEREVLASFHHPLLPRLHAVLRTDTVVGYAIDYCSGHDLNFLRKQQTEKMFSDNIIRFYAAELVLALEYLHNLGIVYRDLKPENVMVQGNGHIMLVDFDLSTKLPPKSPETHSVSSKPMTPKITQKNKKKKRFGFLFKRPDTEISPEESVPQSELGSSSLSSESDSVQKSNSFVGTEEYVAPEIILGNGHDFAVDWWCLGVVLYEMLYGKTPFRGDNRKETFYRIITKAPDLTGEATPLRDLIGKLLEKAPTKRISEVEQIKGHEFFRGVDWEGITKMPRPPFIPDLTDVEDTGGKKYIDVETFVKGVFKVDENSTIEKSDDNGSGHINCEENRNKDDFLFFDFYT